MTQEQRVQRFDEEETPALEPDQGAQSPRESVEVEGRPEALQEQESLLEAQTSGGFRARWDAIQASFVDQPREAVSDAEQLLDDVFGSLTEAFGKRRESLEDQWNRGGEPSTEDLRQAIQHYRTLFQRLLSA